MATDKGKETRKMMLYVGGAAAVVALLGGYWLFGSSDEPATGGSQVKAQGLEGKTGREKANDPQYNKLLNEWNVDNSDKAALTGDSFISTLSASNPVAVDYGTKAPPPKYSWESSAKPSGDNSKANDAEQKERERQAKAVATLLQKIDQARTPVVTGVALATPLGAEGNDKNGGTFSGWTDSVYPQNKKPDAEKQQGAKNKAKDKGARLVSAYTLVPAVMDTAMDSDDQNSIAIAHVPTGAQAGAKFYSGQNRLAGDGIRIHFTGMELNGVQCKVDAYGVASDSLRAAVSSNVNNRWFSRIILPAVANGLGRTGQLYADSNSQMIITDGGNAYRSTDTPDGKAVAGTIIGGMGEQAGRVLADDAARLPIKQVTVDRNQLIGIQFVAPVYESDCGENLENASAEQAQQQATPTLSSVQPQQTPQPPAPNYPQQNFPSYPGYGYGTNNPYYR
ncbi:conjugal transfer protein TraO [Escherichia coli]|nr:conjugal transfer protein TraO [Escherichia coli]